MIKRFIKIIKELFPLILFGFVSLILSFFALDLLSVFFYDLSENDFWFFYVFGIMIFIVCASISLLFTEFIIKILKKKKDTQSDTSIDNNEK